MNPFSMRLSKINWMEEIRKHTLKQSKRFLFNDIPGEWVKRKPMPMKDEHNLTWIGNRKDRMVWVKFEYTIIRFI